MALKPRRLFERAVSTVIYCTCFGSPGFGSPGFLSFDSIGVYLGVAPGLVLYFRWGGILLIVRSGAGACGMDYRLPHGAGGADR